MALKEMSRTRRGLSLEGGKRRTCDTKLQRKRRKIVVETFHTNFRRVVAQREKVRDHHRHEESCLENHECKKNLFSAAER